VVKIPKKSSVPSANRIRQLMAEGKGVTEIARKYGVTRQRIYQVLKKDETEIPEIPGGIITPKRGVGQGDDRYVDPETGLVMRMSGKNAMIIGHMGDEKVTAFIAYHLAMVEMRKNVNKKDVDDLRQRFYNYLRYCMEHTIMPNNMNAYFAIGVTKDDISLWKLGKRGTPEHKDFAEEVTGFFASVHEQAPTDGLMNPISAMFWQKAHDGIVEQNKFEVPVEDPLGQKQSEAEIRRKYADVELPDD